MTDARIGKIRFNWARAFAVGLFYWIAMTLTKHYLLGLVWVASLAGALLGGIIFGPLLEYFFQKRLQKQRSNDGA